LTIVLIKTAFLTHQKSREGRPDRPRAEFTYEPEIDDLVIFVGGRDWGGNTLANGGPVGSWITGSSEDRRYNGDDFQPWSGSISFDTSTAWFFDPTPATLDDVPRQQYDFIETAVKPMLLSVGYKAVSKANKLFNFLCFNIPLNSIS
jgi:hypothetical protein